MKDLWMANTGKFPPNKHVEILHGIPEAYCYRAAEIYFDAFEEKIGWLLGGKKKGIPYIASVLNPEFSICAICRTGGADELAGLVGFKTAQGAMIEEGFSDLVASFGFLSAFWRALALSLLQRRVESGVLLMDGIAVAADQRGAGIGTKLLKAVVNHARRNGYKWIRLDVIDSNPRARALYERFGFDEVETEELGPFKHLFGFSSSTEMVLRI